MSKFVWFVTGYLCGIASFLLLIVFDISRTKSKLSEDAEHEHQ